MSDISKPTFLFYGLYNGWLGIIQRVKAEGYPVKLVIATVPEKGSIKTGRNILSGKELGQDFFEILNKIPKEELIIMVDDNGKGPQFDFLHKLGYKIFGGSAFADKIEHERSVGSKLMGDIGLNLPKITEFEDLGKAISFVEGVKAKDPGAKFVFKPEGEEFAGGSKTYTSKNGDDLLEFMRWLQTDMKAKKYDLEKFQLQEFVEGYEADFSAYFDGEKFMDGSVCLDIEEKKVGDGNKGQATGCMGNVIMFLPSSNKYYQTYLSKLAPYLKRVNYVGQISINNIFAKSDGQPYALELTPRAGWDSQPVEMAIHKAAGKNIGDFYQALVNKQPFKFNHSTIGVGVRVHSMSPDVEKEEVQGRRFTFKPSIEDKLWLYGASKTEDGVYQVEDGAVLVASAVAPSLSGALKELYEDTLTKIYIPDIFYRTEIGKRAPEVLTFLKKNGWL